MVGTLNNTERIRDVGKNRLKREGFKLITCLIVTNR